MTKKHFIALADHLKYYVGPFATLNRESIYGILADFCESQNPRFKRGIWLAYIAGECGPNGGKRGKP